MRNKEKASELLELLKAWAETEQEKWLIDDLEGALVDGEYVDYSEEALGGVLVSGRHGLFASGVGGTRLQDEAVNDA